MPLPIAGLGLRLGAKAASGLTPQPSGPRGFNINVQTDIREASRMLKRVGERNIPMAVAQSLTGTAIHLRKVQMRTMPKYIDRPTRFTQKQGIAADFAKWRDYKRGAMYARVYVRPAQEEYLKYQVYGGTRPPKKRAVVVPGKDTRLNKYGNLTRRYLQTQLARDDTHVANINGTAGLWKRMKSGKLKLLVLFADQANYAGGRWPFFRISQRIVDRELPKQINKAVRRALDKRN